MIRRDAAYWADFHDAITVELDANDDGWILLGAFFSLIANGVVDLDEYPMTPRMRVLADAVLAAIDSADDKGEARWN